ncbi:MAG: hypothetical protein GX304_02265, partial [Clostridiales bacterium]|nr:hypothetical protein [Clostridiales bacterium]
MKRDRIRDNAKAKENILILKSIKSLGDLTCANTLAITGVIQFPGFIEASLPFCIGNCNKKEHFFNLKKIIEQKVSIFKILILTPALSAEQIKEVVAELKQRKEKYEGYLKQLDESGKTQIL